MLDQPKVATRTKSASSSKPSGAPATRSRQQRSPLRLESLAYQPHPGQRRFHDRSERIRVVVAGRRWGKDVSALAELVRLATACATSPDRVETLSPRVHCWIVAPTWAHTNLPWRWLRGLPRDLVTRINETTRTIELTNDVVIECKTAERPDDLVGAGLDVVVLLEAGLIASSAWDVGIRPMLASPGRWGMALVSGTPRGRSNWFFRLYRDGQNENVPDVWSMQAPTWDSPLIAPAEIESMRNSMPSRVFQQEIAAEFVDGEGAVFRGIQQCIQPPRKPKGVTIVGIDWGMRDDYTALAAVDETMHVVGYTRFRKMQYEQLIERAAEFVEENRAWGVVAETNGIGDPLFEQLSRRLHPLHIRVAPFMTTNEKKARVIDRLAFNVERATVTWPEEFGPLTNELELYEYAQTQTGRTTFSAPSGQHDDSVIALALAVAGMEERIARAGNRARGVRVG